MSDKMELIDWHATVADLRAQLAEANAALDLYRTRCTELMDVVSAQGDQLAEANALIQKLEQDYAAESGRLELSGQQLAEAQRRVEQLDAFVQQFYALVAEHGALNQGVEVDALTWLSDVLATTEERVLPVECATCGRQTVDGDCYGCSADRERAARLRAVEALREIEDLDTEWGVGTDQNMERARSKARAALASQPVEADDA